MFTEVLKSRLKYGGYFVLVVGPFANLLLNIVILCSFLGQFLALKAISSWCKQLEHQPEASAGYETAYLVPPFGHLAHSVWAKMILGQRFLSLNRLLLLVISFL